MLLAMLPWSALTISTQVTGNVVIFSLKKFLENPAALTFVLSLPAALSLVVVTITSFLSDRVWTKYGRRKPFVLAGFAGTAICFFLMPLTPNFWSLVVVYLLLGICLDLGSPIEPLKQEIVPPRQRGRATGVMFWINQAAQLTFMFFIFGRFDDVKFMGGIDVTGETGIYWSSGLIAVAVVLLIALGIKETRQPSRLTGQRLSLKTFFGGLTDRELLPVYILILGAAVLQTTTGPMGALLYTDQWGYTKQDMGTNIAIGGVLNLFLIAILTLVADRLDRLRAYQVLILVSIGLSISYYCYVHFILPDRRPTLLEIILFGEMMSITGILTGLIYTPLIYDYVVRNKMGTYVAGAQLVTRLTNLIAVNGAGLFIVWYAALFQPPAGEMVRVVVSQPVAGAEIRQHLEDAAARDESAPVPGRIHVDVWNANGMVEKAGKGLEIRIQNPDSERLAAKLREVTGNLNPLIEHKRTAMDRAEIEARAGSEAGAERFREQADKLQAAIDPLRKESDRLSGELARRSEAVSQWVSRVLINSLAKPADFLRGIDFPEITLATFPLASPSAARRIEKILPRAREDIPGLVDIRVISEGKTVEAAFLATGKHEAGEAFGQLRALLEKDAGLIGQDEPVFHRTGGIRLLVETIEEPVPHRMSPVTRMVRHMQALFGAETTADAIVLAVGRALRNHGEFPLTGARAMPGNERAIEIVAVVGEPDAPASPEPSLSTRLWDLGVPSDSPNAGVAHRLMEKLDPALAAQRLTLARPHVTAAYTPIKYDYMAGNLLTILLSFVGLGITMVFYRLNRKGTIRKWGLEEAEATE